ncbi:MAG: hypothetical protein JWN34_760, partial [Bryobacterales bacterium]|nr:hypothetical protein [Bryobacterales bacterium]
PIFEGTIYDPKTARLVNGQNVTDPFPGNLIPADRLDPVALKIQGFLPGVSNPGLANNWTQNALNHLTQYIPSVKIDQILNSNARLAYYVSDQRTSQLSNPDALPVPITAVRTQEIYGWTHRLNYDQTISPTLIMHLGTGYLRFYNPDSSPADVLDYDATKIGFTGSATTPGGFPRITGLSGVNSQGSSLSFGPTNANHYYDSTLTSVASLTWVRGNHTYKLGGEFRMSSWTDRNSRGSQGILNFNGAETALPYLQSTSTGGSQIGFPYASFLLGQVDNASVNAVQDPQLRKKSWGLYLQDTFKLTRKLTIDYGLRWDLQSEGHEIHYRTSMFGPTIPNPSAGGLPGALVFEGYGSGRCNCQFTKTYPYAIGPRLGAAYQIDSKTVLRAGWGISYGTVPNYQYITNQALLGVGFNQIPFASPTYGTPAVILQNGLKYNYADLYSATLNPGLLPLAGQINSPNYYIDPNGGRPPRINQWNISLQRQLTSDLLVEAAYVGNRGVWLGSSNSSAGNLINLNAINQSTLAARGIDIATASGQSLLRSTFASGTPQKSGFSLPYASFPPGQTLAQSLRPFPQFGNISTNWAPLGNSWYDSLQVKVTKRMSHGLSVTSAFTYSKTLASPSGTVNNVFNRPNQKGLASFDQPFILTIAADYQTPKITPNRYVQAITGGWTIDGIIQRTSGSLIASPQATTNLNTLVYQNTLMNRVPGVPLYSKDLNCHCIDPNKEFVLNPAAWADAPAGTWGTAAAFYGDYRQQRRPQEQASIGRIFRLREKVSFQIRAEFFNILNRTYLGNPSATNPTATQQRNAQGVPTAGYGFINAISLQANPRNGQIVGRLTW